MIFDLQTNYFTNNFNNIRPYWDEESIAISKIYADY